MRILISILLLAATLGGQPRRTTLSVLATTDLHGNIYPIDYLTDRPAARGLARIATLVREARARNPNTILIDCGDTIQGSMLESVYQNIVRTGQAPLGIPFDPGVLPHDPMMMAMNYLGYDAMAVGNHEFNFGLKNLEKARSEAHFPWISANIQIAPGGHEHPFAPYVVKTVAGIKVAVIGITTPAVPTWEEPRHLGSYRFTSGKDAAEGALAELRRTENPDVVVAAVHAGLGREPSPENIVFGIATGVPGIDAIFFGHTHRELAGQRIGNVLVVQPKNWGMSLGVIDFTLEQRPGGGWKVVDKTSRLIPVTAQTAADEEILRMARPYQELAERYLNTPVAVSPRAMDGSLGRVEDTPLVDAIQAVQLYYSKADISFTALFNPRVSVPEGPVTVRQMAALYGYDNELYCIEGTGRMVKEALENAARYFLSCQGDGCSSAPLINTRVMGFNYDMAEGVAYEIDLTRPYGERIRNLTWKGKPLDPDQKLRIAVNNYRAAGSAGYSMFIGAKVMWQSTEGIRDLIVRYYTKRKRLPAEADGNWRIVPSEARQALERRALADGNRTHLF